jgi:hypothetical protein
MAMVKIIAKIFFMGIASFIVGCIRVVSVSTVHGLRRWGSVHGSPSDMDMIAGIPEKNLEGFDLGRFFPCLLKNEKREGYSLKFYRQSLPD